MRRIGRGWKLMGMAVGLGGLLACGTGQTSHCDFTASADPEPRCQERTTKVADGGVSTAAFQELCSTAQGDPGDGPCPTADQVLGCDITSAGAGETVVDWYYPPETAETAEAKCTDDDGQVLQP